MCNGPGKARSNNYVTASNSMRACDNKSNLCFPKYIETAFRDKSDPNPSFGLNMDPIPSFVALLQQRWASSERAVQIGTDAVAVEASSQSFHSNLQLQRGKSGFCQLPTSRAPTHAGSLNKRALVLTAASDCGVLMFPFHWSLEFRVQNCSNCAR